MQPIVLASQSPRRRQLLEWAEIPFKVITADIEETYPGDLPVKDIPVHIARNKALAVMQKIKDSVIIAADTLVVLDNKVIGKPEDRADAVAILQCLAGRTHSVITGVVISGKGEEIVFADETEVTFHALTTAQIEFYVDKYRPYDKAGAYAIQEWIGVVGIQAISGDFYNVMGLPVSRVVRALRQMKVI